jgi:hypothetical protein
MELMDAIMYGFLWVGFGFVFFSFMPSLLNVVFWPQYLAEQHGSDLWRTWPVVLELVIPALAWTPIFLLLGVIVKWIKKASR